MGVFLFDSGDLNKQDKQINFLRQADFVSGENCSTGVNLSDKLSLYQGKLFHLSNIIRQAVVLSREFVPLEQFAQTRCLGMCFLLFSYRRQPVTILGELVPHERFSQTSGIIPLI